MIKSPHVDGELWPTMPSAIFNPPLSPGYQNMRGFVVNCRCRWRCGLKFPWIEKILHQRHIPCIYPRSYLGRMHYGSAGRGVLLYKFEKSIIIPKMFSHLSIIGDGGVFQDEMQRRSSIFAYSHYLAISYPQNNDNNCQESNIY